MGHVPSSDTAAEQRMIIRLEEAIDGVGKALRMHYFIPGMRAGRRGHRAFLRDI
jgi:hypothetical protein